MEWFVENWYYVMAGFYVAEKIVALTPTKHDDIVLAIIKGALNKAMGGKGK